MSSFGLSWIVHQSCYHLLTMLMFGSLEINAIHLTFLYSAFDSSSKFEDITFFGRYE